MVAEGQKPLGLPGAHAAAALHLGNVGGSRRIAAGEPDQQRRSARPAHAEKPHGKGGQQLAQQPRQPHAV